MELQGGGERWYNWYGITCNLCRKAIADGIVPAFAAKHRHSWYAAWEFNGKFGLKSPTVRKLVRQGKLIARIVLDESGGNYEYIFLKKENPEYRDPERYSPGRKSYDRNRARVADAWGREQMEKHRKETASLRHPKTAIHRSSR